MRNFSSELCECVCEKTPIDVCAFVLVVSLRKQIIESQKLHRWRVQYVRACHSECASSITLRRRHLSPRASPPPWEKENEIVDIHHRELGNRCAQCNFSCVFSFYFGEAAAKRRREELGSWALETSE